MVNLTNSRTTAHPATLHSASATGSGRRSTLIIALGQRLTDGQFDNFKNYSPSRYTPECFRDWIRQALAQVVRREPEPVRVVPTHYFGTRYPIECQKVSYTLYIVSKSVIYALYTVKKSLIHSIDCYFQSWCFSLSGWVGPGPHPDGPEDDRRGHEALRGDAAAHRGVREDRAAAPLLTSPGFPDQSRPSLSVGSSL